MKRSGVIIFLLIQLFAFSRCSSVDRRNLTPATVVDGRDGIDRPEAIVLAQQHIRAQGLEHKLKNLTPFAVEEAHYLCTLNELSCYADSFDVPQAINCRSVKGWRVAFKSLEGSIMGTLTLLPYYVAISSETGSVLSEGLIKK